MEPKFQSSFIPKGPLATSGTVSAVSKVKKKGIVGFLSFLVFICVVGGTLVLFGYNWYLNRSITKMSSDLQDARAALEPETITELSRLHARLLATDELLSKHVVLSPLFDFLENATLKSVRFTDFDYRISEKGFTLTLKGQARGYSSVALQSEIFNKSKYLKNQIFSDLQLDDKGNVVFTFNTEVDPTLVSFKKTIESSSIIPPVVQEVTPATSTPVMATSTLSNKTATTTSTTTPKTATSTKPR